MKGRYGEQNGKDKPVRKQGNVGGGYDAPFRGYINVALTDEQKAQYEVWSQSASYWESLEFNVADGVNISLKVDPKSSGFLASATQRRSGSPNAGLVVTARAKDASTALGRVVYILAVLGRKERWEDSHPLADPDRW